MAFKYVDPFDSVEGVANQLGVSDKTVRRWIWNNELRAYKLGHQWRIYPDDLDYFLKARRK